MNSNDSDQPSDIFIDYEGFYDDHLWGNENNHENSVLNVSLNDAQSLLKKNVLRMKNSYWIEVIRMWKVY